LLLQIVEGFRGYCGEVRAQVLRFSYSIVDTSIVAASEHPDEVLAWSLREVAEAAREIPLDQQPERLRRALERVFVARPLTNSGYDAGTSSCST
jgi:hypothetical protein